ncbi:hypothetical protein C8F04DRAFT_595908 [Mycena alexandri]|uniref:Uncharacterized protein n=1 Tax=Mycena alexandri TaxID=1745969 RepID=A0AAD6TEZ4_9AGAR|nr:hypothetical protein C8F04DRAFT_595908 [Mycena alexandri]
MHLKSLFPPLLAFLFTASLVDLTPVTALYFPAHLGAHLPTSLLALFTQYTSRKSGPVFRSDELKARMEAIVRSATALHEELQASVKLRSRDVSAEDMSGDLQRAFEKVVEELKEMFPAPEKAPGHEERRVVITAALEKAGVALTEVCTKYGMDEERVNAHWRTVRPAIEGMVVVLGDLAEQHPDLLSALLFTGAVMLIPNYVILRPLLGIFGFGPTGPIKGTTASWAQRVFYGAAVNKGSWFAYLDKAAMTIKAPGWLGWLGGVIGVGLGGSIFASCGGRG